MQVQQLHCPFCQHGVEKDHLFCYHCGASLHAQGEQSFLTQPSELLSSDRPQGDVTFFPCSACEYLLSRGSAYCNACGAPTQGQAEVSPEADSQGSQSQSEQQAHVKLGGGVKALELPRRKRRAFPAMPVSRDPFIEAIESLLSLFERLARVRPWSILPTIIGAVALEIVVAQYVSSHFSITIYVPLDAFATKTGVLSPEEFLLPANATCVVFVTNIIVTLLLAGGTMVSCIFCHRKQSGLRARLLFSLFVIEMLFGMAINPIQIILGAVPPPNVGGGNLAVFPIFLHCVCGITVIVIVFPLLSRKKRTVTSVKGAGSKG